VAQPAVADTASEAPTAAAPTAAAPDEPEESPAASEPATEPEPPASVETASASPVRLTVDLAKRGATLPEFALAATDDGEWVTILLTAANQGEAAANVSLAGFSLRPAASETGFAIDRRSTVVASILRLDGAPDELDAVVNLDPGETIELALVFQVPSDETGLTLVNGETTLELDPEVANAGSGLTLSRGFAAETPDAIGVTVLDRILGQDD
ncbi:MAG: DUF4352 domain-containing protein, partial [Chloroflexota bacterium]|nr:DUF4352 domain-containing protein [Chloroflexota bacterium]